MSTVLYIAYLAYSSSFTAAKPIPPTPLQQLSSQATNGSSSIPIEFEQRSTWDIVWGCLATIFACSWVSVHPHIPPPDASWRKIALIRFELMVWTILAPEVIILLAAKQWIAARQLKKAYQERRWTITHGFFIQMGGFMLFDGDVRKGVLSPQRFKDLIETEQIVFPTITEEEILDRSKGDGLSKSLVLVQTAWFIAQFVARIAQGLAITQLELATFAFAALNGVMYFFWWNKPLDIRLPIPTHLVHKATPINEASSTLNDVSTLLSEADQHPYTAVPSAEKNLNIIKQNSWRRIIAKAWHERFHIISSYPDYQLLDRMSVPIFFSSSNNPYRQIAYAIATVLGMLFGVVHCTGWNLFFPSAVELRLWRISSIFIIAYPAIFLVILGLDRFCPNFSDKLIDSLEAVYSRMTDVVEICVIRILFAMYVTARIFILVDAFLALRSLPTSAMYAVQWTAILPHV